MLLMLPGWIYPVCSHWAWHVSPDPSTDPSTGWLASMDYQDFAGSGVVHFLSGLVSLVACWFMGPRMGRFDSNGRPREIAGHSVPMAALGGFILLFGFLAFNGGSRARAKIILIITIITMTGRMLAGLRDFARRHQHSLSRHRGDRPRRLHRWPHRTLLQQARAEAEVELPAHP